MLLPAFSTVACPEWTLETVARSAADYGFPAVELRTFGDGSLMFACDPALTGAGKVLDLFREAGVAVASLATSISFHQAVDPPVLGHAIADNEGAVRAARRAIDLASSIECPLVRVFGYQLAGFGGRAATVARIADRLKRVVDHADKTGVRVAIENGGDFQTAAQVMEIVDQVGGPLLGVCYNVAVGQLAGERAADALNVLGSRTLSLRLKNLRAGMPVNINQAGDVDVHHAFEAAKLRGLSAPAIFEWDRAWMPTLEGPELALPHAAKAMFHWLGGSHGASHVAGAASGAGGTASRHEHAHHS